MEDGNQRFDQFDMGIGVPWSDTISLPADPVSATDARHFVRNTLTIADIDSEIVDNVELVVSELVTNAVLHAATGPTVGVFLGANSVRLEVRDASTSMPTLAHFGNEAATGRGLSVVSRAAKDWGFDSDQFGKTVWAEFDIRPPVTTFGADRPPQIHSEVIIDKRVGHDMKQIEFNGVPVDLFMELEEANDATLREFELLAFQLKENVEKTKRIHEQLASVIVRSGLYFGPIKSRFRSSVLRAKKRRASHVDLKAYMDADSVSYSVAFVGLMAEADALSAQGVLLTGAVSEPVRQLRLWFNDEIRSQFEFGRPPMAFAIHS